MPGIRYLFTIAFILLPTVYTQRDDRICYRQADIAFVVDSSGSINDEDLGNFNKIKNFMKDIVNGLEVGEYNTRIAVVTFSNRGKVEFFLNDHFTKQEKLVKIDGIRYAGGNTNTSGGLWRMREEVFTRANGDRPGVPNMAIVITDGVSTTDSDRTIPFAHDAKADGIRIISVGIGKEVNMAELMGIASPPMGRFNMTYSVERFDGLKKILEQILIVTCMTPTVPPSTTPALRPIEDCRQAVDLAFIMDASGSIQAHNFEKLKQFARTFIEELPVETGNVRVAMVSFSTSENKEWLLDDYHNRRQMIDAVDRMRYLRGSTNTAAALRFAHVQVFRRSAGDRPNVANVLILLTDGQSNDRRDTLKEAKLARDKGIHVIVVGIGDWLDEHELDAVATYPHDLNRFRIPGFHSLDDNFQDRLLNLICNNENDCQNNPCQNHLQCVDEVASYSCVCSPRYGGRLCDQRCDNHADVVFAIDASGSMRRNNFKESVEFVRDVIQGMRIGSAESARSSRVGVMTFANQAEVLFNLKDYTTKSQILNGMPPYYTGGTTNTAEAIRVATMQMFTPEMGDQQGVPNILVVLTDGKSNDEAETWQMAMEARDRGVTVVAIGVGASPRLRELQSMASAPTAANVMRVRTFGELRTVGDTLVQALCNNNNDCLNRPCRNGGQCVDLINGYECRCPQGYTGSKCERNCDGRADVAFVVDSSGSIHHERFPIVLDFVKNVVDALEIAPGRARVGVASWSNYPRLDFTLNKFSSKQDVMAAVQYISYMGQRTNTASALRMLREQIFTTRSGDRDDVPNYAFIVTDGNSNINEADTIKEAIAARQAGVHVFVVSVGKQINSIELKGIASSPVNQNIYKVERFQDLQSIIDRMPHAICDDVNECSSNPCRNGGRCVNGVNGYTCRCREGRVGYNCDRSCRRQLDVTLLLDLSGSVEDQYDRTIAFTRRVVYGLDMTFGRTRVAIITFGDHPTVAFDLLKYREKEEVITALSFYPNRGQTNTQGAIRMMRNDIFSASRGDRSGVQNVGILVTDGYSNVARYNTIPEAEAAKNADVAMYVVAIGDAVDMGEVNAIAGRGSEPPDSYVFRVANDGEIEQAADNLADQLCQWTSFYV